MNTQLLKIYYLFYKNVNLSHSVENISVSRSVVNEDSKVS